MRDRTLCRTCIYLFSALCFTAGGVAQQPPPPAAANPDLGPATERGLRFTPGMARAIADLIAREALVREFELDQAKVPEVSEAIARRLMVAANANDEAGASLVEYMIVQACEAEARQTEGGQGFSLAGDVGKGFADRVLPMVPLLKQLMRDITQDVRPHLAFKQQLKWTAGMATASTVVDSLEKNMQRWQRGEAQDNENPFETNRPDEKDANGRSKAAVQAQEAAAKEPNKEESVRGMWEKYLKDFKAFYELDAAQYATGESILREYLDRTRTATQESAWRDAISRARLWINMASGLRLNWGTPIFSMLFKRYNQLQDPINTLGDQFRHRLEEIPTEAQRTAADARMTNLLAKYGYGVTTQTAEGN